MTKKKLYIIDELKDILDSEQGFVVIYMHKKPTNQRTMIHNSSCNNLRGNFVGRYGVNPNKKLGKSNGQEYYYYNSFNEIMNDYPKAKPCKKCKPTNPLT